MAVVTLRPCNSIENIEWNLNALLGAIAALDESQIGAITADQLPSVVLRKDQGGIITAALEVTGNLTQNGTNVALAVAATTSALGLVKQATAVADLNQTISATYSQAQVQDLSNTVDDLLAALRAAGVLAT